MQAIILAAGKSTRTEPLTINTHKVLLKVANKTLIEHNLDQLTGLVDEVIIVVGFLKEQIIDFLGNEYNGMKITYIEQKKQLGTGDAIKCCKPHIKDKFILMMGDDLYSRIDITECLKYDYSVLAKKVQNPERFGIYVIDNDNFIKDLIEKPKEFISDLANCALYILDKKIFKIDINKSERGEYEITDAILALSKEHKIKVIKVNGFWLSIGYAWHLLDANKYILDSMTKSIIKGTIEDGATIKGNIFVDEGTVIKSGVYIEGPAMFGKNCNIGPNCYIRAATTIGNNCKIGNAVEVKNSVIMDNTNVGHLSYIGDSVIAKKCNFGAGTMTSNLRHDGKNMKTPIKGKMIDTVRRKLGVIMGQGVHTGINTTIYPARKFWPNTYSLPGEIVIKDKK